MKSGPIPSPTIQRLSLYLRHLETLLQNQQETVSSRQLGSALKLTDAQVRKDLARFGQFGRAGVGYEVAALIGRIRHILGTDRMWHVLLVGAGNLGQALSAYRGFAKKGFKLVAVFDNDASKVGSAIRGLKGLKVEHISDMPKVIQQKKVQLAILATPAESAQEVAEVLVAAGIKGILNFAPVNLDITGETAVSSVDLAVQLEQLSYQVVVSHQ